MDDGDTVMLGCLGPTVSLALIKIVLFVIAFYALGYLLGFWGN